MTQLAADGFGGIVAVGGGSDRGPRFVELSWQPPEATCHVVLVGKGITFDTGGICIKPVAGMKLMRKDMGGAAASCRRRWVRPRWVCRCASRRWRRWPRTR